MRVFWFLPVLVLAVGCVPRVLRPVAADSGGVLFRLRAPEADTVAVVGNFNAWDPAAGQMSDPDGDGVWRIAVSLPPGQYRYQFVVDGRWVTPPNAPRTVPDGFGGKNGIVDVPADLQGGQGADPWGM